MAIDQYEFFDVNCAVGDYSLKQLEYTSASELIQHMDFVGIKKAFVYHLSAQFYHPQKGNGMLLEEIEPYKERLFPCWVLLPTPSQEMEIFSELVERMKTQLAWCVRLYPRLHSFEFTTWNIGDVLDILQSTRVPVLIDVDQLDFCRLYKICSQFPRLVIILTNPSYYSQRKLYPLMKKFSHVYVETSTYLIYNGLEYLAQNFGSNRILFGTRMPFQDPGPAIARLSYASLNRKDKMMIASESLQRLINEAQY